MRTLPSASKTAQVLDLLKRPDGVTAESDPKPNRKARVAPQRAHVAAKKAKASKKASPAKKPPTDSGHMAPAFRLKLARAFFLRTRQPGHFFGGVTASAMGARHASRGLTPAMRTLPPVTPAMRTLPSASKTAQVLDLLERPDGVTAQTRARVFSKDPTKMVSSTWLNFDVAHLEFAFEEACRSGLQAYDAIHVAVAVISGCDELITTEKPTSAIHRTTLIRIVSIDP
jgi:predicted nucleic acid-binding protein